MEFALYQVPAKVYPSVNAMLLFVAAVCAVALVTWVIQKEARQ